MKKYFIPKIEVVSVGMENSLCVGSKYTGPTPPLTDDGGLDADID